MTFFFPFIKDHSHVCHLLYDLKRDTSWKHSRSSVCCSSSSLAIKFMKWTVVSQWAHAIYCLKKLCTLEMVACCKGGKKQKNAGTLASARDNWSNSGYLWMKPMCQPWCAAISIRVRGIKSITFFIPQALMLVAAVSEPQFGHGSDHV